MYWHVIVQGLACVSRVFVERIFLHVERWAGRSSNRESWFAGTAASPACYARRSAAVGRESIDFPP